MTTPLSESDIASLPIDQRIELAMNLLDSVYADLQTPPISDQEIAAIRERIAVADADPSPGASWDEVKQRLLSRRA